MRGVELRACDSGAGRGVSIDTLVTETDDGVRLWIDDELVIDDWTPHFVTRNETVLELVAEVPAAIRVEYFEVDLDGQAPLPPYRNPSLRPRRLTEPHVAALARRDGPLVALPPP